MKSQSTFDKKLQNKTPSQMIKLILKFFVYIINVTLYTKTWFKRQTSL